MLDFLPPVEFAVVYGSGVYKQNNYAAAGSKKAPTIDMIVGVNDGASWHEQNLTRNPHHYASTLRYCGPNIICRVQDMGAGVFYHPIVNVTDAASLKYGVVSVDKLTSDLEDWNTLFCAGRMQKPTLVIKGTDTVDTAQKMNLRSAISTAVLLLPEHFSPMDLFVTIAGLSYRGDPRFDFGAENSRKVDNIVEGNIPGFVELYAGHIRAHPWIEGTDVRTCEDVRDRTLRRSIGRTGGQEGNWINEIRPYLPIGLYEELKKQNLQSIRNDDGPLLSESVHSSIYNIVRRSAFPQYAKGVLTAGLAKSMAYVKAKLEKGAARK